MPVNAVRTVVEKLERGFTRMGFGFWSIVKIPTIIAKDGRTNVHKCRVILQRHQDLEISRLNRGRKSPLQFVRSLSAVMFCTLLLAGCEVIRQVPVQMARVPQLETYKQVFTIGSVEETYATYAAAELAEVNALEEIDQVFQKLIGQQNWQTLKDHYGIGDIRDELVNEEIYLRGSLMMMIYLDPVDHDVFLVEGQGQYFLIRQKTGLIMLNGAFMVRSSSHGIADLDKEELPVTIELITTRIPGRETYYNPSEVVYKMAIDHSLGHEGIYALDYDAKHKVFLADKEIGHMKLDSLPASGPSKKLIDLRGRHFLKKDYGSL